MASYTEGDTYPPFRGWAKDESGELLDLTTADALLVIFKSPGATITGTPTAIALPGELDADGITRYNWKYDLAANDTAAPGTYEHALKVTWDSGSIPPRVEYFPSSGSGPSLTIKAKLA